MNQYSVSAHWPGPYDEAGIQQWAEGLRSRLSAPSVSLGLVFMSPRMFPQARQILEILRVHARIPLLAGCSSHGHICGGEELEENTGVTLGLYHLPGAELRATHFEQSDIDRAESDTFWPEFTGVAPGKTNGWLAFLDPFTLDSEGWLSSWSRAYRTLPVLGGLASGESSEQMTQVYLNGEVFEAGAVAVSIGGDVNLEGITSQGCTPIGETWIVTKVEQNIIREIGKRPAYEVLSETFTGLAPEEQQKARGNLFIGLVMNEYLEEFHRGDFLIRNLLGADPKSGSIAVGAWPRQGQTVQFQRRSAAAATEDLEVLLNRARHDTRGRPIYGGCLCSCNGRGRGLFDIPNHDAAMAQQFLGPIGLTGFFCNGEIGPVGKKNFIHGYTASLALFVKKGQKVG